MFNITELPKKNESATNITLQNSTADSPGIFATKLSGVQPTRRNLKSGLYLSPIVSATEKECH